MVESNPYATPSATGMAGSTSDLPLGVSTTMVHQIRVVAVLLIVHGVLVFATGAFYVAIGLLMPYLVSASESPFARGNQGFTHLLWIYFAMAGPAIFAGALQVVAGVRVYDLRNRKLGIAAVLSGILASSTCYCAPTGFILAIYGSIVLFNSTVAYAFKWRAEGATAHQVFARIFAPYTQSPASPTSPPAAAGGNSHGESAPHPKTPPVTEPPTTMP